MMPQAIAPPMVGRERELEALLGFFSATLSGDGRLVFISGEAGIGKSRLCEEFERLSASTGSKVVVCRCVPGPPVPYLPFKEAIGPRITRDARVAGRWTGQEPHSENERFIFSTLGWLRRECCSTPLIMRIEDLQWVDTSSMQLLHFLARNLAGLRVLLIGTYRPEDLLSVENGPVHPLTESLRLMRREGLAKEIALGPLGSDEIVRAVRGLFDTAVEQAAAERIAEESGGNPLYAVEVAKHLAESGSLVMERGRLRLAAEEIVVPTTVRDVILRRIERLPSEQKEVLEAASVIGRGFDVALLGDVVAAQPGTLEKMLDRLGREHQMLDIDQDVYSFRHEKIRQVAYDCIPMMRRRELHRLVGEHIERTPLEEGMLGQLSMHFDQADQKEKALKYALMAGEACVRRFAMAESGPYFEKVLKEATVGARQKKCRARALEGLGTAHLELSNYETAARMFEELILLDPDPETKARALRKEAECYGPTRLGKGNSERLLSLVSEAEAIPEIEDSERGECMHYRTMIASWNGRPDDAQRYAAEAERIFRETGPVERLAMQLTYDLTVDISRGAVSEVVEKSREIWDMYRTHPYPSGELELLNYLGVAYAYLGRLQEARVCLQRSIDLAEGLGDYPLMCWGLIDLAMNHAVTGDSARAVEMASEARERAQMTESPYMLASANAALALHLLYMGRAEEAGRLIAEAQELTRDFTWTVRTPTRGLISLAAARHRTATGDWESADVLFEEAQEHFHGAAFSMLLEGLTMAMHGEELLDRGWGERGRQKLGKAVELFEMLGNHQQAERIRDILADGAVGGSDDRQ